MFGRYGDLFGSGTGEKEILEFPTRVDFPVTGDEDKLYIAQDTDKAYIWSGTEYVMVSANNEDGLKYFTEEVVTWSSDMGPSYDYKTATLTPKNRDQDIAIMPYRRCSLVSFPSRNDTGDTSVDRNVRGQESIDLQLVVETPMDIAFGERSVLIGGYGNSAMDSYAICTQGYKNITDGCFCTILNGHHNIISWSRVEISHPH